MLAVRYFFVAVIVGGLAFHGPLHAQVDLERFFPPVVGGSEEVTITAEGKFPRWPCEIRCDRPDIELHAADKSGQVVVKIAKGAPPGVAWVRLIDTQSVSSLVPLLIERNAVTLEPAGADGNTVVNLPAVVTGRLARGGEVDSYSVTFNKGETFVASVIANQWLESPMDAVMQLADRRGNVLAQSDDSRGLDPQLVFRADEDTDAIVRIFAFPSQPNSTVGFAGANSFVYAIEMTTGAMLDHVLPIVVGAKINTASPRGWNLRAEAALQSHDQSQYSPSIWFLADGLGWYRQPSIDGEAINVAESAGSASVAVAGSLPVVFTGSVDGVEEIDRFRFDVSAGKKYRARSASRSRGFLTDPVLRIVNVESGAEIARKDDNSRVDFDAQLEFTAKSDGQYELQVSDAVKAFGPRHVYAAVVSELTPSVKLTVASDRFRVAAGDSVEIPVALSRDSGFAKALTLQIEGLPDGVTAAEVVSEGKGDSAKSVKLKLTADSKASFQGTFRVAAIESESENSASGSIRYATFNVRNQFDLSEFWLTVGPQK